MAKGAKKYRFVGTHPDTLDDGRPIAPGEFVYLTDDEMRLPHNEMHASSEHLLAVSEEGEKQVELADKRVAREDKKEGGGEQ